MATPTTLSRALPLVLALAGATFMSAPAGAAPVTITTPGVAYTQSFDSLANTGGSSSLPTGWALRETGSNNPNDSYVASDGSLNTGNTYSFGATSATDRAFGMIHSNTLDPMIGVQFLNGTGAVVTAVELTFFGEQWRLGLSGHPPSRLDFQYSLDATSLGTGTWTNVDALDVVSPTTIGAVGALNGNAAANRITLSGTLSDLNIPNGGGLWLRWVEADAPGAEDGLGIDDFTMIARGVPEPASFPLAGLALAAIALATLLSPHRPPR